ncbi:MAG: HAD hydrolase-like protein [Acidobacteriota bacterium]
MDQIVVFDMDGVLAEVTESYRQAIVETVEHFTGQRIERDSIQAYKNAGGWNNDWALSQKIAADLGVEVPYQTVVDYFNEIFIGPNHGDGLIQRETWFPQPGMLERLSKRFGIALFTGRLQYEADITLRRFAPDIKFDPMLCAEHVTNSKPAPDGLLDIQRARPGAKLWYIGDTVDDARSARAAGVAFIGIVSQHHSTRAEILRLFAAEKAVAVVENVNEIEGVL